MPPYQLQGIKIGMEAYTELFQETHEITKISMGTEITE